MSYSNEAIKALAQLATATGGLHDRMSRESDQARAVAGEMITAANAAKLQAAMRIGEMKMQQNMEMTKESLTALKGIAATRIEAGELESSALDSITGALDRGESLTYMGAANLGDARNLRKDFIEYVDSVEEGIKSNKLGLADILVKKGFLGKDSSIVKGTLNEMTIMRDNLANALEAVEKTQQFDPDLPETYIEKGKRPGVVKGIFTETEQEVAARARDQITLLDQLIFELEK